MQFLSVLNNNNGSASKLGFSIYKFPSCLLYSKVPGERVPNLRPARYYCALRGHTGKLYTYYVNYTVIQAVGYITYCDF
jgi:hypothetical protein